jgi:hypothetical protein
MAAETRAAAWSGPLPCETESVRAFGLTAIQTGIPIRSRPVMSPTLVMPKSARIGAILLQVSDGEMTLLPFDDAYFDKDEISAGTAGLSARARSGGWRMIFVES